MADQAITFHIQASTFPNWNGVEQKRPISVNGDGEVDDRRVQWWHGQQPGRLSLR